MDVWGALIDLGRSSRASGKAQALKLVVQSIISVAAFVAVSMIMAAQVPVQQPGERLTVLWDLGHNNFDDADFPAILGEELRREGYTVRRATGAFDEATLKGIDILISKNPIADSNKDEDNWTLPISSAFSLDEIEVLRSWVESGGALLLVVDHMPMGGAAAPLLSAFGFEVVNGFAIDEGRLDGYTVEAIGVAGRISFSRLEGTLTDHPVTTGRSPSERVGQVVTAVGTAIRTPNGGRSALTFGASCAALLPQRAWTFDDSTSRRSIEGWSSAGFARIGSGRIAVLADSMLLRSSLEDTESWALENPQFTLNVIHWLAGMLDDL